MCLVFDASTLPPNRAGVVTPAFGMGQALVARLNKSGMSLTVGVLGAAKSK
jgi:short subunit dehydrogenase-like uncharacterized protein